jgi:hypothetical protein
MNKSYGNNLILVLAKVYTGFVVISSHMKVENMVQLYSIFSFESLQYTVHIVYLLFY